MSESRGSVLIIDDDPVLRELLSEQLRGAGYDALCEPDGAAGLRAAACSAPDMVVLDVMMPGLSGWEVCERLRACSPVPIMMLTARDDEIDKLRAFKLGADDYVTVPCSFAEVVARIGAVLGRCRRAAGASEIFASGDLVVDLEQRSVTVEGRPVEFTALEFRLLAALARRSPRPVDLDALVSATWGEAAEGGFEQVKHHVWALRRKLEADPGNPRHLVTARGFGYRLQ
ncbi:MAG TPA: response regulator transcription factor [Burkholderiales bacterium]